MKTVIHLDKQTALTFSERKGGGVILGVQKFGVALGTFDAIPTTGAAIIKAIEQAMQASEKAAA